ncbi:hypothetical protein ACFLR4_00960 [Bacteroidota bacterium]
MLTPDDGSNDGSKQSYLSNPKRWAEHDKSLYYSIYKLVLLENHNKLSLLENTNILLGSSFYSEIVLDYSAARNIWFDNLQLNMENADLIFFDPDNGIEVKSKPYGSKDSSKYIYWKEIEAVWERGKSLIIYQHFPREKREVYLERMLNELQAHAPGAYVDSFNTSNVAFLTALQPAHKFFYKNLVADLNKNWAKEILSWKLNKYSR